VFVAGWAVLLYVVLLAFIVNGRL